MRRRRTTGENGRLSAIAAAGLAALFGIAVGIYLTHKGGGLAHVLSTVTEPRNDLHHAIVIVVNSGFPVTA
jgi:hypothetical protein